MIITKEWILEQMAMYKNQRDSALNTANANQGAIEALDVALIQLEKEEEKKEESSKK